MYAQNKFQFIHFENLKGVRLGEWDLSSDADYIEDLYSDEPINVGIAERIVHEGYNPLSVNREHDIALLRLSEPVDYTYWVKPLCLPSTSSLRNTNYGREHTFTTSGWGVVSFSS